MSGQEQLQTLDQLLSAQRWDEAISVANAALVRNPQDAGPYASLAAAHLGAGRPADALYASDNAVRLAPSWEWSHRMRARALAALGWPAEALSESEEADRLDRDRAGALEELGTQQLAQGRLAEAEATANDLVRIAPEWGESHNLRGRVLLRKKRAEAAEIDFRDALRLSPDEPAYMNNIGLALHRRGKRKEAIEWFQMAATRDPKFAPARTNLFASRRFYLWGGASLVVMSIAFHGLEVGLRGGSNSQLFVTVAIGLLAAIVPVVLLRYRLRKRSLQPIPQAVYDADRRSFWQRLDKMRLVRLGGFVVLFGVSMFMLFTNQTKIAFIFVVITFVWVRGWEIWRFAGRLFQR